MAEESKKYLINIESNLDKYIKEAELAKKRVDELKLANMLMTKDTPRDEVERNNAALRDAQKDYRNATKSVDLATQANKAQSGSYEQLYKQWQLAQTQLKLMGSAYIVGADGVRTLSQKYIDNKKAVEDAKRSLDAFGKGIADNRLNVGNYSEAIEGALGNMRMMPGALGQMAGGVQRLTMAAKAFIATPLGAILAAIALVIGTLVKAFKNSQPLMDAFDKVSAAIGATIKVLIDRISNFAEFLGSIFNKELRESRKEAKALNDELIGIEETMSRREKREIRRAAKKGFFEEIKEEAKQARDLTKAYQVLEDAEIAFIQRKAEMRRTIEELFASTKDENLTNLQRIENLDKAIALTKEMTEIEVGFAKERARISQERVDQGNSTREELRLNEEAQSAATEAEAQGFKEIKRLGSERFSLIRKVTQENIAAAKEREDAAKKSVELAEKEMEAAKKQLTKELDDYKKFLADKREADIKALADKRQQQIDQAEWERNRQLIDQDNLLQIRELNNQYIFDLDRARLEQQRAAEVESARQTGEDINLINAKYAAAQRQIDQVEADAKLMLYSDFAGNLAQLFGEQTVIGKLAAIAQTTISTWAAAQKAYESQIVPGDPTSPIRGVIAAAASVALGLVNVKKILAVKSGLPGDTGGGSVPSAISGSMPAQRAYAPTVGATFLTQPQLTQPQINALPNQNLLTAADIAAAISKLPSPIVTVEDINAKTASVRKIEVRGNI